MGRRKVSVQPDLSGLGNLKKGARRAKKAKSFKKMGRKMAPEMPESMSQY